MNRRTAELEVVKKEKSNTKMANDVGEHIRCASTVPPTSSSIRMFTRSSCELTPVDRGIPRRRSEQ